MPNYTLVTLTVCSFQAVFEEGAQVVRVEGWYLPQEVGSGPGTAPVNADSVNTGMGAAIVVFYPAVPFSI